MARLGVQKCEFHRFRSVITDIRVVIILNTFNINKLIYESWLIA